MNENPNKTVVSYELQKEYYAIGIIILALGLYGLLFIRNALSIVFVISIISPMATTPYRIDLVNNDFLIIFRIFRKKKIKIEEIISVSKGAFRDKIVLSDDYFYLDHLISNIGRLTDTLASRISHAGNSKSDGSVKRVPPEKKTEVLRMVLVVLIAIFLSVYGVFYFKEFVKHL